MKQVVIIGGGFSGTLVLANLVRCVTSAVAIHWFDAADAFAKGVAYGTRYPIHLLNVRADHMGAFGDNPGHFWEWLNTPEGKCAIEEYCPHFETEPSQFAPRMLYAAYLEHIKSQALKEALLKGITITQHSHEIKGIHKKENTSSLHLWSEDLSFQADAIVLATGNFPPYAFPFLEGRIKSNIRFIKNVWNTASNTLFPEGLHTLPRNSNVVIIGAGLTTVDTVLTLRENGYKGSITAISRHGLLPQPHAHSAPYPAWELTDPSHPEQTSINALFKRVRQEIRVAAQHGYDWRSVVDSLRPVTPKLWNKLSTASKSRFLRHLSTLWNTHRHRMAPQIHGVLKNLPSLSILAGKITNVIEQENGFSVMFQPRGKDSEETMHADMLINCSGPNYRLKSSDQTLLGSMLSDGLIEPGPLHLGLKRTSQGAASGRCQGAIYAIGPLLVGEELECTAVPELRKIANQVAQMLASRIESL